MNHPKLFGLHARPSRRLRILLGILPFAMVIIVYLVASDIRLAENPSDKLLPGISKMMDAIDWLAFTEDKRTGEYLFWKDTFSSLQRLLTGVACAAIVGLLLGLNMGMFYGMSAIMSPFMIFIAMIPPLAILPILFITFGIDELGKITLIFLGVFPVITRDIFLSVRKIPQEQIVKALTLGASHLEVVYRIVLPQIVPRLLQAMRLSLGAAWLFLIAAEAIASTDGLGYRIFLVRRYLSMDIIIPYVIWITILGFCMDYVIKRIIDIRYKWYVKD